LVLIIASLLSRTLLKCRFKKFERDGRIGDYIESMTSSGGMVLYATMLMLAAPWIMLEKFYHDYSSRKYKEEKPKNNH